MGDGPVTIHTTGGSFGWIEGAQEEGDGLPESLVRVVEATYEVWGEENWIVRREFSSKFPSEKYLRGLGVPYARQELERRFLWIFSMRQRVLSLVFEDPASCIGYLESDYPDERLLVFEAYPREHYATAEDVLREKVEDMCLFDSKSVVEKKSFGTVLFNPSKGTGRVFARDDSAIRFKTVMDGMGGKPKTKPA